MKPCVAILIPTFRRPEGLAKALRHIAQLQTSADVTIHIADNEPTGQEGVAIARRLSEAGYPFRIVTQVVAAKGVSHVRNALISAALADQGVDFLAFLDDDEWPEPQWLEALLDMQRQTGAHAVGGSMSPAFAAAPRWAETLSLYRQENADGPIAMLWGTCNLLLTRQCVEMIPAPWFDVQFGLTGGEDVEFFERAKSLGATFAWASRAQVFEDVPASRTTLGWVLRRSFRIGDTNARTQMRWRFGRLGPVAVFVKAVGRLPFAMFTAIRHCNDTVQLVEASLQAARSMGEIAALFGLRYREYG